MRALIVDDEELAINHLVNLLQKFSFLSEILTFTTSKDVVKYLDLYKVDIAFIDIEMPEMDGLELSIKIRDMQPTCKIIFTTAYDHYAVNAFELRATDYIVKPVTYKRLLNTMERIDINTTNQIYMKRLCLFGDLRVIENEIITTFDKWRTQKVKDIFFYLLHMRNKNIHRDILIELFWQDQCIDKATAGLYRVIYYLRKMIEDHQKVLADSIEIKKTDIGYQLKVQNIELDIDLFDKQLKNCLGIQSVNETNYKSFEELISLYTGKYLDDVDYWWIEGERNKYQSIWRNVSKQLLDYYYSKKLYQESIALANHMQKIDPMDEETYQILIKLYQETKDKQGEIIQKQLLEKLLHYENY
nr:response regulator [Lysinibacillus timonensis]